MDEYNTIARENTEAFIRANEREDDECIPRDPSSYQMQDPGGLSFEEPCLVCRMYGYKNCQGHIPNPNE